MNFTVLPAHTENTFREILRRIVRLQSGGTIDSLQALGADTTHQLGASFVSLRQLAAGYTPDEKLSLLLWNRRRREEQIIACFLMSASMNVEKITQLIHQAVSNEVAEYFGSLFLASHPDFPDFLEQWSLSGETFLQVAALTGAARHRMIYKDNCRITSSAFEKLVSENYSDKYVRLVAQRYRFNI